MVAKKEYRGHNKNRQRQISPTVPGLEGMEGTHLCFDLLLEFRFTGEAICPGGVYFPPYVGGHFLLGGMKNIRINYETEWNVDDRARRQARF